VHEFTRDALIQKLGTLLFANAELATQVRVLQGQVENLHRKNKELEEAQRVQAELAKPLPAGNGVAPHA
jgi:hypothetical protein